MKRARDIRDQLVGLMERVEIEIVSDSGNLDGEPAFVELCVCMIFGLPHGLRRLRQR
jgi:hypothetical protein